LSLIDHLQTKLYLYTVKTLKANRHDSEKTIRNTVSKLNLTVVVAFEEKFIFERA